MEQMKCYIFTRNDHGSDRGCFTVIICASCIESARLALGEHFYERKRELLVSEADTIPYRIVHMNDLHLVYSDLEKGLDTQDHDREGN